ncbi:MULTISPECIES: hypothetical protein [unclassified Streptomyces]|uniref:hypothetical protein n=1 Tax=unclassified Streptomyces TaxID=2593676 RepID=UPI00190C7EE9|nr:MULTISPECIES: hypothetical protein [unclassified Streptomyces]MBK3567237.1 hypothetical protein [Streptomyces sp. MBT62]MBK6018260.1 hypothetical protein [Streptomyces sp. MBT53]
MEKTHQERGDIAATVMALSAESAELQTRVTALRRELVHINERMTVISTTLHRLTRPWLPDGGRERSL